MRRTALIGGSKTNCPQGVYGTQGVAADTNVPGARAATIHWTDTSGNVWLFGGGGCDSTGVFALYGDLWKFSSSGWTSIAGDATSYVSPVYGTQGVASAANTPGGRDSASAWTDANGNMLLFGGFATGGLRNDLWEYLPSSNQWAWIGGPNIVNTQGVYGVQGVAAAANVPGARSGSVHWTDADGNYWLFGGYGYDASGTLVGLLNDLWKYAPSSGQWTWVAGSSTFDAVGTYGTQGVAAVSNMPGARAAPFKWKDASGTVWLFGGFQYDDPTNTRFEMNDLWRLPTQ